jgi:cell wall hydrolase
MPVFGRNKIIALAGAAFVAGSAAIPASLTPDMLLAATLSVAPVSVDAAREAMLTPTLALVTDDEATDTDTDTSASADSATLDPELECMAKVVYHEAANQPREGQLAVAQLIMNRVQSGRFPTTICGVANQPGQFFHTASYNPPAQSARWAEAVEVSREARDGSTQDVSAGAIFYHAAYRPAPAFFRTRTRVMRLGDHIFYR